MLQFINFALESTNAKNPYANVREKMNTWLKAHPQARIVHMQVNLALFNETTAYAVSLLVEHPQPATDTDKHASVSLREPIEV